MGRCIAATLAVLVVAACSPPSAPAADPRPSTPAADLGARAGSTGAGAIGSSVFTVQPAELGGQWSFDRSCGLYDLVFTKDTASYYDYGDPSHVVSYSGGWAIGANNRVVLSLHRLDAHGAPTGAALTYNLDVAEPVVADLIGSFGQDGGEMHNITAKQCANEDRE